MRPLIRSPRAMRRARSQGAPAGSPRRAGRMKLTFRPLTPDLWPALEDRFGKDGACSGCWCMYGRYRRRVSPEAAREARPSPWMPAGTASCPRGERPRGPAARAPHPGLGAACAREVAAGGDPSRGAAHAGRLADPTPRARVKAPLRGRCRR